MNQSVDAQLASLENHLRQQNTEEAALLVDRIDGILNLDEEYVSDKTKKYLVLKRKFYHQIAKYHDLIPLNKLLIKWAHHNQDKFEFFYSQVDMVGVYVQLGRYKEGLEMVSALEADLEDQQEKGFFEIIRKNRHYKAQILSDLGETDTALGMLEDLEREYKDDNNIEELVSVYNSIGRIHYFTGEIQKSVEIMEKSRDLLNVGGSLRELALIISNLGILYFSQGDLSQAYQCYQDGLSIWKKLGNEKQIANVLGAMGQYYGLVGDLSKSVQYHQDALAIKERLESKEDMAISLSDLGEIYSQLGRYSVAEKYHKRAYKLRKEIGATMQIRESLYHLIVLSHKTNKVEQAKNYFDIVEELPLPTENKREHQLILLGKSVVLMDSGRRRNITKAEVLLKELLEEDPVDLDYHITALRLLSEILLSDLQQSLDPEILDDLQELLEMMRKIAEEQQSIVVQTDVLFIQSMLELLMPNGSINTSKALLDEAERLCRQYAIGSNLKRIRAHRKELENKRGIWGQFQSLPVTERLQIAKYSNYLDDIQNLITKPIIPADKEDPYLLLVLDNGGITRFSHRFQEMGQNEVQLIGSFITALNNFSQDLFSSTKSLETIKHHDYTIVFANEYDLLFAYIFKGENPHARSKLDNFVKEIYNEKQIFHKLSSPIVAPDLDEKTAARMLELFENN